MYLHNLHFSRQVSHTHAQTHTHKHTQTDTHTDTSVCLPPPASLLIVCVSICVRFLHQKNKTSGLKTRLLDKQ